MKQLLLIILLSLTYISLPAQSPPGSLSAMEYRSVVDSETADSGNPKTSLNYKVSGYVVRTGIDILASGDHSSSARMFMVHGHRFTPTFSAGFGIGYTPYNDPLSLIPFFIDLNYRFLEQNTSPFLSLKAGYNFSKRPDDDLQFDSYTGGLLFNPAAGVEINFNSGMGIYFSAGYNIDNSSYQYETWGNRTVNNYLSFRRLSLSTGFVF